jgi:membrane carboxypeptidase/penicillin-binding protein PbpC
MRLFSRIVSLIALWLLRREWLELRPKLTKVYRSHIDAAHYRPTTLAQQLLISGEDHRFFCHGGIDPIAICRAIWRGIVLRRPEGASTIEMQVVRIVSGRFERTLRRKIHEMMLATLVTQEIPKKDMPAIYLEIGYFGWRMNGFKNACKRIGISQEALTPAETARLVARLKYPQPYETTPHRWQKINARERHLLALFDKHNRDYTYIGLVMESQYESL